MQCLLSPANGRAGISPFPCLLLCLWLCPSRLLRVPIRDPGCRRTVRPRASAFIWMSPTLHPALERLGVFRPGPPVQDTPSRTSSPEPLSQDLSSGPLARPSVLGLPFQNLTSTPNPQPPLGSCPGPPIQIHNLPFRIGLPEALFQDLLDVLARTFAPMAGFQILSAREQEGSRAGSSLHHSG